MVIQDMERESWAFHPVTQEFLMFLKDSRQEAMEAWAAEAFVGKDAQATTQSNAKALGGVNALLQVIEIIESYYPQVPTSEFQQ
jgi:hypothetical protein